MVINKKVSILSYTLIRITIKENCFYIKKFVFVSRSASYKSLIVHRHIRNPIIKVSCERSQAFGNRISLFSVLFLPD